MKVNKVPQVVAAVDGSHFKINKPDEHASAYYSGRKKMCSFNVQICSDGHGSIVDLVPQLPGSCHDARIYRNSNLYKAARNKAILNGR